MAKIGINAVSFYKKKTGTERYVSELVLRLSKLDRRNNYVVFCRKEIPADFRIVIQDNIKFIVSPFESHLISEQFWLPLKAYKENLDLLYSPGLPLPVLYFRKSAILIFDISCFHFPEATSTKGYYYFRTLFRNSARKASIIFTSSEYSKGDISKILKVDKEKIVVTYLGFDDEQFKPLSDDTYLHEIRMKFGLPNRYIISVSTLAPRKNYPTLIDAFAKFKKMSHLDYKLVIAGRKGWKYEEIFKRIAENKLEQDILFLGHVGDDLPAVYNLADIFVLPTLFEGFGLTILESMACGTPVITSNNSSIPEVAADAGILIDDPYDVTGIADAMLKLTTDKALYNKLKAMGIKQAKKFSWYKMTTETIHIFAKILEDS